jgi:hypothetical protein
MASRLPLRFSALKGVQPGERVSHQLPLQRLPLWTRSTGTGSGRNKFACAAGAATTVTCNCGGDIIVGPATTQVSEYDVAVSRAKLILE